MAECGHPVCRDTPRYSQRIEECEWPADYRLRDGDRAYWSNRACGIASLRSVLSFHGKDRHSSFELLHLGIDAEAYGPAGWWHAGLATLATGLGVPAATGTAPTVEKLQRTLRRTGSPMIASVTLQFPLDGRRGGHLVVVTAVGGDGTVCFRDPSTWGERNTCVPAARFASSFTGRVISFSRPIQGPDRIGGD